MTYLIYFIIADLLLAVLILIRVNSIIKMRAQIQNPTLHVVSTSNANASQPRNMGQTLLKLHGIK